jgi:hypothetical protein
MRKLLTLLLPCFFLLACGASKPSDDEVQKTVASLHSTNGELAEWKKINAEETTINGQKRYAVQYVSAKKLSGHWYFTKDVYPSRYVEGRLPPGLFHASDTERMWKDFHINASTNFKVPGQFPHTVTELPVGSIAVFKGQMTFKQTENGWVLSDSDQSSSGYCNPDVSASDCWKRNGW